MTEQEEKARKQAAIDALVLTEKMYLSELLIAVKKVGFEKPSITSADFYNKTLGKIFDAILKLKAQGVSPNEIMLYRNFPELTAQIAELPNIVPTDANMIYYENQIREASKKRLARGALEIAYKKMDRYDLDADTILKDLIPALSAVVVAKNETGIQTARDIMAKDFPPYKWVIPSLVGSGLTIMAGAPKIGKSWLALSWAIAAATGAKILNNITATRCEVLYITLEDNDRRLKDRMNKIGAPTGDSLDRLHLTTTWHNGIAGLHDYLKMHREIQFVIIDTLGRFLPDISDFNDYGQATSATAPIKAIADELDIAILLVHHAKKGSTGKNQSTDWMDAALGSQGFNGAADSTIVLQRGREKEEEKYRGTLYATGRDTEDYKAALVFDEGLWSIDPNPPKRDPKNGGKRDEEERASWRGSGRKITAEFV